MKKEISESWKCLLEMIRANGGSTNIQWNRLNPESVSRYTSPDRLVDGLIAECKNGNQISVEGLEATAVQLLASPNVKPELLMNVHIDEIVCQWKI